MILQPHDHILFYGDSITDCGQQSGANESMGFGYAAMVAAHLNAQYPAHHFRFTNKGISGNRMPDLQARLQADVLDLKPNFVSILIGINDTWRRYDSNDMTPLSAFEEGYESIITQMQNIGARVLICEPFLLHVPIERAAYREDLNPRIDAVRRVALKTGALYLPLDGIFAAAATQREPAFWAADGVHPTFAGHALIAKNWINTITE